MFKISRMQEQLTDRTCFSHEGEDVILEYILGNINYNGSFLDIGAHHPIKFSNTYKFYLAGWRGINIEARPGSSELFNSVRPLDINLEIPISDKEEELTYYVFNNPELNSFSEEHVSDNDGYSNLKVVEKIILKTTTIDSVLKKHCSDRRNFDLLSLDVEGFDLRILKTIDFERYLFNFLIVEDKTEITNLAEGEIYNFLISKGYKLLSKLFNSTIYYFDYSSYIGRKALEKLGIKTDPKILNMSSWVCRFMDSVDEIKEIVPKNESFILVDQEQLATRGEISGRKVIPFPERNGQYWGQPDTDATAITEIEREREKGATFMIFAWPAFWWLDYYSGMHNYLTSTYKCIFRNERLIVFNLN